MSNLEFMALYKDPRWQKKRLEILERDGYICQSCGAEDKTLHVHHQYYEYGKKPWEYPNKSLFCYCEDCHKRIEEEKKQILSLIKKMEPCDYSQVLGYITTMEASHHGHHKVINITDNMFMLGISNFFSIDEGALYQKLEIPCKIKYKRLYELIRGI